MARLTLAAVTPGTFSNPFSTRRTQEAQVMPSIGRMASVTPGGVASSLPFPLGAAGDEGSGATTGSAGRSITP